MFLLAGPGFLAGSVLLLAAPRLPDWGWGMAAGGVAVLLFAFRRWPLLAWMSLGMGWTLAYVHLMWHPLAPALHGRDLEVVGTVAGLPVPIRGGWRFGFLVEKEVQGRQIPSRIRLSWYGGEKVASGQRWRLTVRLREPRGFSNPGGFDYERWLFAHRIGALGYVVRQGRNRLLEAGAGLAGIRQRLADAIDAASGHEPAGGVVKALAVGARDGIDDRQWRILRATGTAHLVAISGLHIGLVAGMMLWIVRATGLGLGWDRRRVHLAAALVAFLAALIYAALAGFSLPTQRALIMLALGLGGWLWQRDPSPWRILGLALLGVCLWDPLSPLSAGFWLSFVAVGWIFYLTTGRLRAPSAAMAGLQIQGGLLLGLAPLSAFFFGQVGWSAPLANAVAVPAVGFVVVPLALLGCLFWWLEPGLSAVLWQLAGSCLSWLWLWLEWLSELGEGIWQQPPRSLGVVVLALSGVALLLMPPGLPGRWLGGVLLLPLLFPPVQRPADGESWVTVLDVGQGLAVVVETASHVLVYDTGPRYSDYFDAGADIVTPFLRARGWRKLDRILVSHADRDHSGGLPALAGLWKTQVMTSVSTAFPEIPSVPCRAGQRWRWDGVTFRVLWPRPGAQGSENDLSCVVKIETKRASVLLPGDIEAQAESSLLNDYGGGLKSDVLVAPHHGSATSSSWRWLRAVGPRYVLISSGYRNRFGFPSRRNLDRYRDLGARVLNTATAGAIEIHLGKGVGISRHRMENRRLWSWRAGNHPLPIGRRKGKIRD